MLNDALDVTNLILGLWSDKALLPFDSAEWDFDTEVNRHIYTIGPGFDGDIDGYGAMAEAACAMDGDLCSDNVGTNTIPAQVIIGAGGDDSSVTFTIAGTNVRGDTITEDVDGANTAAVFSTKFFKTVTGITASGNVASSVDCGAALNINTDRPIKIKRALVRSSGTDTPVLLTSQDRYYEEATKTSTGTPTRLLYERGYPTGRIVIYPSPSAAGTIWIDIEQPFKELSSSGIDTAINLPSGMILALRQTLCVLVLPEYGGEATPDKQASAIDTLETIRELQAQPLKELNYTRPKTVTRTGQPADNKSV